MADLQKNCRQCNNAFTIAAEDLAFYEKVSPVFNGKKEAIPAPTLCPDCRQRRRLAFRNEYKLFRRKCDFTSKDILAMFEPNTPWPVYNTDDWYSDSWNALSYGRDFDFTKTLTEQLLALRNVVPQKALNIQNNMENSAYSNNAGYCSNCYLCFNTGPAKDCYYVIGGFQVEDCMDVLDSTDCQKCYECLACFQSFNLLFSQYCFNCSSSAFLSNCRACSDCLLCNNLSNRQYCIRNVQYSKEEYLHIWQTQNWSTWYEEAKTLHVSHPNPSIHAVNTTQCTGDEVYNSKECQECYTVFASENLRYCSDMVGSQDSMDVSIWGADLSLCYESTICGNKTYTCRFCVDCWENVSDLLYCISCTYHVAHCFACVGLRNAEYCILNKQYSHEEYETLVPRIIEHMRKTGEWGELLHPSLSYHGYQNTKAQDYFPLNKEEALHLGFNWSAYEAPFPKVEKTIPAHKLPDDITKVPDDILNWAIICEISGKPFRVIKQELEFYRKHNLPIPKRHPEQRHLDRLHLRNPRKLWENTCSKCHTQIITTHAPTIPGQVYCEACYNREVYG